MKIRVVVTNDGQVSLYSDDGTYAEGKEKLEMILGQLKTQGIELTDIGQVEQHRHDDGQVLSGRVHTLRGK